MYLPNFKEKCLININNHNVETEMVFKSYGFSLSLNTSFRTV